MAWDPEQYARYRTERSRPFFDLLARVPSDDIRLAVDLGCGSGELTRVLAERWPLATVLGVDSSLEMLAKAKAHEIPGRLHFVPADLGSWRSDHPPDLIFSNAALHWVRDHERAIPALADQLSPGGVLAVQMPNQHREPSHEAVLALASSPAWSRRLRALAEPPSKVQPLAWYVGLLLDLGFEVDAWESVYLHVLSGPDPILEWLKGTTLRPYLALLEEDSRPAFLHELGEKLRLAYPSRGAITLFPFRRIFFVARRSPR